MFKAFVDEDIRKRFCILIRNENDVDKLLDYLKYNNIGCFRNPIIEIDKSSIMDSFKLCRISHPNFYLYFCYNEFTKNFRVSYGVRFYREEDARNCYTVDDIIEEAYNTVFGKEDENMFTKKDLKDGMVVKTREGNYYLVCGDLFIRDIGYLEIDTYNNDLTSKLFNKADIVTVYAKIHSLVCLNDVEYNKTALWKREEVKEMTIAEIEKELGYSIKVVKEKENE